MRTLREKTAVVIGAVALATGVLAASGPAQAQFHRYDLGVAQPSSVARMAATDTFHVSGRDDPTATGCKTQRQRVWDGYSVRIQRRQVCD